MKRYHVAEYRNRHDLVLLNQYGDLKRTRDGRYILFITQDKLTEAHEDDRLQGSNETEHKLWNDHGPILHPV